MKFGAKVLQVNTRRLTESDIRFDTGYRQILFNVQETGVHRDPWCPTR